MNIKSILSKAIQKSLLKNGIAVNKKPFVQNSSQHYFGDYQSNEIIRIATKNKKNPYKLANKIIHNLNLDNICSKIEPSKNGIINFYINTSWIEKLLEKIFNCSRIGVNYQKKEIIIVDYSSPNVAKEMHIGHLRSTIIGDAVVKNLEFLGHHVIRVNHIGDWGLQFGMLIAFLKNILKLHQYKNIKLNNLEKFYQKAKVYYDNNPDFAKKSKKYTVKLQKGDHYCYSIWKKIVSITMTKNQKIYNDLKVSLKPEHTIGESFYQNMLNEIVNDLIQKKIAVKVNKSIIVFLNEFKNRDGLPMGVIIQKEDGCFLYTTIDIACLKYRYQKQNANRIIYYTDSRQKQHLEQVFIIAKKAGYVPNNFLLEHHIFGMVLSKKKQPFKTRSGNAIRLSALITESKKRARSIVLQKKPSLPEIQVNELSEKIGIGAIKYADLSKNRTTNYVFDWNAMLKFDGNTAPYIQYAYVRIASILNKSKIPPYKLKEKIILKNESERNLAIKIIQFEEIIEHVTKKGMPHLMCSYLYELSVLFSNFYEKHSILFAQNQKLLQSRLKLLLIISKVLKKGLYLLGIDIIKEM